MAVPKSAKLRREEAAQPGPATPSVVLAASEEPNYSDEIVIREIPCCNEHVAVLQSHIQSSIALADDQKYKNEGVVVGVGPGVPDGGVRVPSQLKIGDVVMFQDRHIITTVESNKPPYQGRRIVIINERSLLCKLPPVKFTLLPGTTADA